LSTERFDYIIQFFPAVNNCWCEVAFLKGNQLATEEEMKAREKKPEFPIKSSGFVDVL
jgi:hypothetical protein